MHEICLTYDIYETYDIYIHICACTCICIQMYIYITYMCKTSTPNQVLPLSSPDNMWHDVFMHDSCHDSLAAKSIAGHHDWVLTCFTFSLLQKLVYSPWCGIYFPRVKSCWIWGLGVVFIVTFCSSLVCEEKIVLKANSKGSSSRLLQDFYVYVYMHM